MRNHPSFKLLKVSAGFTHRVTRGVTLFIVLIQYSLMRLVHWIAMRT